MTNLQDIRKRRMLTQAELAAASGVSQQVISKIETRESINPGALTLYKLAQALRCTVDDLIVPPLKNYQEEVPTDEHHHAADDGQ